MGEKETEKGGKYPRRINCDAPTPVDSASIFWSYLFFSVEVSGLVISLHSDRFTAEVVCLFSKCFYDQSSIYQQLSSSSLLWLSGKCVCHALFAPPVVLFLCECVCFCKCDPHPWRLSEMPVTSYDNI